MSLIDDVYEALSSLLWKDLTEKEKEALIRYLIQKELEE
jgi:hypothetical protein